MSSAWRPVFQVRRNGLDIADVGVRGAISTGITYSQEFEGFEACVAAGLNIERWATGDYPIPFMAKIVAWYRLHNLIEIHKADAVNRKQRKK
jgi:hypothetical protein